MARPAFAGRRARSRIGQLAAFGGVVLLVTAALAVLAGAVVPVLDAGSRILIAQSGATQSAMRLQTALGSDADSENAAMQQVFDRALRDVPATIVRTVSGPADALVDAAPVELQVLADPSINEVAELTDGEWPTGPTEAAIQDAAAAELSLAVGEAVVIQDRPLTITGLWHATDPAAPRWFADPAVASGREDTDVGPLLVDESVLAPLPVHPMVRWTIVPDSSALGVTGLPVMADALARLDTEVRRMGGGNTAVTLEGSLPDTVARATRVTTVAAGVLGLPLVLVAVAGAIVLSLIARAIASGRGAEFVLLRARGASLRAVAGASIREAALTSAIGAVLGAGAAFAALRFGLPLVGATGEPSLPIVGGVAIGVTLLAIVLATIVTVAELRAPVTGRNEAGRAAVIASLGPLAFAVVAAGFALSQFLALGSPVIVRVDGQVRTDPLALTAPVLVLLAGALAAPAIAGPVVAIAERFARAGRGILPVLPLRQLARRTRSVAAGVLVVALACGAVVFAVVFHTSAEGARGQVEAAATGADLRVVLPVRATVEPGRPGASSAQLAGVTGVEASFAVAGVTASVGADAVPLIAGDARLLAAAPSAPAALAGFADRLAAARQGAELPAGATQLTATMQLEADDGIPADLSIDVIAWLVDADGAAIRVPLGSVPVVSDVVTVIGDIPDASAVMAIELDPPALPDSTIIDVALVTVTTDDGTALGFSGTSTMTTLASSGPQPGGRQRLLPSPPETDALPVVLGTDLAERLGAKVGTGFSFRITGVPPPIPAKVIGIVDRIPGEPDSLGLVIDLQTLIGHAIALDGSVPAANQLWVTASDPDAVAPRVRAALSSRSEIVTPRSLSPGPVLDPALLLVELGVAVTALLAVLGFAAVAAAIGQRRRVELTPLRSLGLSVARIRSARAIELIASVVIALLLGAAAGWLTATLVVPGLVGVLA